jgi:hypothetical protein
MFHMDNNTSYPLFSIKSPIPQTRSAKEPTWLFLTFLGNLENACQGNSYLVVFIILIQLWINACQGLDMHSLDDLTLGNDDS